MAPAAFSTVKERVSCNNAHFRFELLSRSSFRFRRSPEDFPAGSKLRYALVRSERGRDSRNVSENEIPAGIESNGKSEKSVRIEGRRHLTRERARPWGAARWVREGPARAPSVPFEAALVCSPLVSLRRYGFAQKRVSRDTPHSPERERERPTRLCREVISGPLAESACTFRRRVSKRRKKRRKARPAPEQAHTP